MFKLASIVFLTLVISYASANANEIWWEGQGWDVVKSVDEGRCYLNDYESKYTMLYDHKTDSFYLRLYSDKAGEMFEKDFFKAMSRMWFTNPESTFGDVVDVTPDFFGYELDGFFFDEFEDGAVMNVWVDYEFLAHVKIHDPKEQLEAIRHCRMSLLGY